MTHRFPLLYRFRHPLFAFALTVVLLVLHRGYTVNISSVPVEKKSRTVTITEAGFVPAALSCRHGDSLSLVVVNGDKRPHNFVVRGLKLHTATLKPGESAALEVVAPSKGTYAYLSDAPGYPETGYQGRLTVE